MISYKRVHSTVYDDGQVQQAQHQLQEPPTRTMCGTLFLVSTMPCEIGIGAFASVVDPGITCRVMRIDEARKIGETSRVIDERISSFGTPDNIIMIGTYWSECLAELAKKYQDIPFHVFCPGEPPVGMPSNVKLTSASDFDGRATVWTIQLLKKLGYGLGSRESLFDFFVDTHSVALLHIDDRLRNRNIAENEPFYAGIYNCGEERDDNLKRFTRYFKGEYRYEEIMKQGKVIDNAKRGLARERAINNFKNVTIGGLPAVVTNASDLVNVTHQEMHHIHPEAKLTLVLGLKFGKNENDPDELAYSWRPQNEIGINLQPLGKAVRGDGNYDSAGGRTPIEIKYKVVPDDLYVKKKKSILEDNIHCSA